MTAKSLTTKTAAIQFAIEFAGADLNAADPAVMTAQIDDFFTLEPGMMRSKPCAREHLKAIQTEAATLIRSIAIGGMCSIHLDLTFFVVRSGFGAPLLFEPKAEAKKQSVQVVADGPLRDKFLYRIIELIKDLGVERLCVCGAPECNNPYFRVGRKEFCSTKCQSRIYMRGYEPPPRRGKHGKKTRTR